MSIGKFCHRNVVCAERAATALDAARLMRQHHVGNLVIVDGPPGEQRPVGIVTDRDIVVEIVSAGLDPAKITLGELLLRPLVTVAESDGYIDTIRLMAAKGVRRMPVVRADGVLVGIITLDDLFRQLAIPLAELAALAIRERDFEVRTRA
jgi:CBS domain-containing protein